MEINTDYLIIGCGVAGVNAATEIKKIEPDSAVLIVSREPVCFYSRVLLTRYIEGKVDEERLILRGEQWFDEQKIDLICGDEAAEVDFSNKLVRTVKGAGIRYKKILISGGVEPRIIPVPGGDLENVYYLWTLEQANKIKQRIAEVKKMPKERQRAVVAGGGFICQTLVKIFADQGLETHLLMRGEYYWSKFIGPEAGEAINKHLIDNGIILHKETAIKKILPKQDGLDIVFNSGESLEAPMAVIGVGTLPNTAWLEGSGLEIDNGIVVDERMRASTADVYAAGDIANFYDVIYGGRHRQGNWVNAGEQGRIAGINMAGGSEVYRKVTSFTVDIFGLNLVFLGTCGLISGDETIVRENKKDGSVIELYLKESRIIGAMLMDSPAVRGLIEQAIKDKITLNKDDKLNFKDAEFPLEKIWT